MKQTQNFSFFSYSRAREPIEGEGGVASVHTHLIKVSFCVRKQVQKVGLCCNERRKESNKKCVSNRNARNEYNEYPSITRSIAMTTPCNSNCSSNSSSNSNSLQPINLACRSESAEAQRAIYEDHYEAHVMRGESPPASCLMPQASCQDPRQSQARPEERVAPES